MCAVSAGILVCLQRLIVRDFLSLPLLPPCSFERFISSVVRTSSLPAPCLDGFAFLPHLDHFHPDHLPDFSGFGQTHQTSHHRRLQRQPSSSMT